jgi:hypothetical protein
MAKGRCRNLGNHIINRLPQNRFRNVDYALMLALHEHFVHNGTDVTLSEEENDIDHFLSYDSNCQFWVNTVERFKRSFPELAYLIYRMRWSIPALHVQGHKEECLYNFSTVYMMCAAHFHGKTAEHPWPTGNEVGDHVRQMNRGHRHDTLIDHHNYWNWKKTTRMGK